MNIWKDMASTDSGASLSVEERLADRLNVALRAAQDAQELLLRNTPDRPDREELIEATRRICENARAVLGRLPAPRAILERDPELEAVLDRIRRALEEISVIPGPEYDVLLGSVEHMAAPEVLSLFYEIERLYALRGYWPDESDEL